MTPHDPYAHRGRDLGFDRFVFFSDAVFAIAITLLVLDLRPAFRADGGFTLAPRIPNLISFALTFYVVGRYWLSHHQLFTGIQGYDRPLLNANLAFLAGIAFLPFPTSVVTLAKPEPGGVVFYMMSMATVGVLLVGLAMVARRPKLLAPGETRGGTARILAGLSASPLVFLASAVVGLHDARLALWMLLGLLPVSLAGDVVGEALKRRIDHPKTA